MLFPFVLGTILGSLAGYFGGWVDPIIMRVVDIVVAFPFYVLVIALVFVLGTGEKSIYIAITAVGWVSYARIIRGEITGREAPGVRPRRPVRRPVEPADHHPAPAAQRDHAGDRLRMSDIVQDIVAIVTLSYLGLGIQPPTPLGTMISDGQNFLNISGG